MVCIASGCISTTGNRRLLGLLGINGTFLGVFVDTAL
jgi:hypothetical protein